MDALPQTPPRVDAQGIPSTESDNTSHTVTIAAEEGNDAPRDVLADEKDIINSNISIRLTRFATTPERLVYTAGILCSAGSGCVLPLMTLIFGQFVTTFTDFAKGDLPAGLFKSRINHFTLYFIYFFLARSILTYLSMVIFITVSTNVTSRLQTAYLRRILRLPISHHNTSLQSGQVSQALTAHSNTIRSGLSDKLGLTVQNTASVIAALVVALTSVWKLSLAVATVIPAAVIIIGATSIWDEKLEGKVNDLKAAAATLEDEVLGSIRTVRSLGAQAKFTVRQGRITNEITAHAWKRAPILGTQVAAYMFLMYAGYALAFWYGIRLYMSGEVTQSGRVITTLFSLMIAINSFSQLAGYLDAFIGLFGSVKELVKVIDMPEGDLPCGEHGDGMSEEGHDNEITFRDVTFEYPARPGASVLNSINMSIPLGKKTALIGTSGCGKSTCVGLLLKWYCVDQGDILFRGSSIYAEDTREWRSKIGFVQQEPQFFSGAVHENVAVGLEGTQYEDASDDVKKDMVLKACQIAQAHDFITRLSDGYNTHLGEKGTHLSGGQKQRLALARAIVKDPPILLLDEATSALDNTSEAQVQRAIEAASQNRTIIAVSHRLSAVRGFDKIVVLAGGVVAEEGTHEELLGVGDGVYKRLWEHQELEGEEQKQEEGFMVGRSDEVGANMVKDDEKETLFQQAESVLEPDQDTSTLVTITRLLVRFKKHWLLYVGLIASAAVGGALYPIQAVLYAKAVDAFQLKGSRLASADRFWGLMWFVLAIVVAFGYFGIGALGVGLGEMTSQHFRSLYFDNLTQLPISLFDAPATSPAKTAARLATHSHDISSLAGDNIGVLVTVAVSLIGTIALGLAVGWKFTLVVLAGALPAIFAASYVRERMEQSFEERASGVFAGCTAFAGECVSAIRTVSAMNMERYVEGRFAGLLGEHGRAARVYALRAMVWFALSESVELLAMALAFWYGGHLLADGSYSTEQFFIVFISVVFGSQSSGSYFAHSKDISKGVTAINAISRVEKTVEKQLQKPTVPMPDMKVATDLPLIEFRDVSFSYPSRPELPVLEGFSLRIFPGQFVAVVGESGSGKSTLVNLLERFYEVTSGEVLLNGVRLQDISGSDLVHFMSLVGQEPRLYQGTIRENMLLGITGEDLRQEELTALAEAAQLSTLIASLPEGFDTQIGVGGISLSGGQRQRVAIARAMARKTPLMLLDEATSALDTASEKLIQGVLLGQRADRRQIVVAVAHRLSTIRDADMIYVMHRGRIVEAGSHAELMHQRGRYFRMCHRQAD